jgi:hypothetical protein
MAKIKNPQQQEEPAMSVNPESDRFNRDPILVDLGRKSRKNIKRLRDGEGKLMAEVRDTIDELKANGTISDSAQPVIVIVREKPRTKDFNPLWPLA